MLLEFQEVSINVEEDKSDLEILTEEEQSEVPLTSGSITGGTERVRRLSNTSHKANYNSCVNSAIINRMAITMDPATKPLFTITPTASVSSMDESVATPSEIMIGIHESDSTTKLQPDGKKNQDSSESLIPECRKEKWYTILREVCLPFLIAGFGMVAAGLILEVVKQWPVFTDIPEFLVLVTPLLGLKGNLEMTLASRLSTQTNLGNMKTRQNQWKICAGNLSLVQIQAIVVGFLASLVAILIGVVLPGEKEFVPTHALLLCTSSMLTASIASFALGLLMIAVVFFSMKFGINPDNVATPIAACLGDVTTLSLLAFFGGFLHGQMAVVWWVCPIIIGIFVVLTPVWVYVTYHNEYTRNVLVTGWVPVIAAMLISSGGGFILDKAGHKFKQLALYQPVINGVGGNLVSVQASRISTALHRDALPGHLPGKLPGVPGKVWMSPWAVFMKNGVDSVAARVLLGIVIPGHLVFSTVTHYLSSDKQYSALFLAFYLTAAVIQVAILLYTAQILVALFWKNKMDPDTNVIPYLTALGDLFGTGLLYIAFEFVAMMR